MNKFWAIIKAGLRARIIVRICTVVSCYFVAFAPPVTPMIIALVSALIFGNLMLILELGAFTEPLRLRWKLRGKICWQDPPPFVQDLTYHYKINLNKKRPYGITDLPIGAAVNIIDHRILVGSDVLALPEPESNAVLAHEMGHLRPNQITWLMFLFYAVMVFTTPFINIHPLISAMGMISLFLLFRTLVSRRMEYDADKFGAHCSSNMAMVSALQSLTEPSEYTKSSDTHPSVYNRVLRLTTPPEPFWIRLVFSSVGRLTDKQFREEFLYSFLQDLDDQYKRFPIMIKSILIGIEFGKVILLNVLK